MTNPYLERVMDPVPHTVHVHREPGSQNVWLECSDCNWTSLWDGKALHVLLVGDPGFGHGGSW